MASVTIKFTKAEAAIAVQRYLDDTNTNGALRLVVEEVSSSYGFEFEVKCKLVAFLSLETKETE
jgi:hypothetical protein